MVTANAVKSFGIVLSICRQEEGGDIGYGDDDDAP